MPSPRVTKAKSVSYRRQGAGERVMGSPVSSVHVSPSDPAHTQRKQTPRQHPTLLADARRLLAVCFYLPADNAGQSVVSPNLGGLTLQCPLQLKLMPLSLVVVKYIEGLEVLHSLLLVAVPLNTSRILPVRQMRCCETNEVLLSLLGSYYSYTAVEAQRETCFILNLVTTSNL